MQLIKILFLLFSVLNIELAQAETQDWLFDVYLDNNIIGFHNFKLTNNNHLLSDAKFKVDFLFFTAYEYQHSSSEYWKNDCLTSLDATTKEDKSLSKVNAHIDSNNFVVHGNVDNNEIKKTLPDCVMTFAYWNPKLLTQTKLLNPQNGDYLDVNFSYEGYQKLDVKGESKSVKVYHLKGNSSETLLDKPKIDIVLWYDKNNDWLGLKSITPEGNVISYKRK
jgi:hypothetical protein